MACSKCGEYVTDGVYSFSLKKFGKILCQDCQEDSTPKKKLKLSKAEKKATPEARKIHSILIKNGFNAQLEKWDGFKHIDIAIPDFKVNIEVDGKQHIGGKQALADLKRTYHSFKKGYVTLRIPNSLVQSEKYIYETAGYIMDFLRASEKQLDDEDY